MYYLSLITIPVSIAIKLESIQCKFLWGDSDEHRRFHLVVWNDVKKPVKYGGLGVRSLVEINQAFWGEMALEV